MPNNILSRIKAASAVVVIAVVVIIVFFVQSFYTIVDAGEVGVVSTFGSVSDSPLQPGFHLKNPFAQVIKLQTRTESYTMSSTYGEGEVPGDDSIQALASDGGLVWFDVTVLYKLDPSSAPDIYKNLGITYQTNIIRPEIRSAIRAEAANYPVNELYSTKREKVNDAIFERVKNAIEPRGIVVESVLIRKVNISEELSKSIESKLAAQQEVQKQEFEIQKAKKEAERKVAEAKGQRDAQQIINQSLSEKYLFYLYINTLKDREGTIYVPISPDNGLPLFKNVP